MSFGAKGYYLISLIIIAAAIFGFMWSFEKRRPKTGEVVTLAVMTSLAVVGRVLFFMTPQFKPSVAIIIVTGIMLGKEAGFLSGALTAFVSDFFFGQGPWTPYQMIAFGIIGFLSAALFTRRGEKIVEKKVQLSVYGFAVTFIIYGLIMDVSSVLMYTDRPSLKAIAAAYITGIVFNLIHGISTFVFLWILARPIMKKIARIKLKYGIYS